MVETDSTLESLFRDNATEIIVDTALISSFTKLLSERLIQNKTAAQKNTGE